MAIKKKTAWDQYDELSKSGDVSKATSVAKAFLKEEGDVPSEFFYKILMMGGSEDLVKEVQKARGDFFAAKKRKPPRLKGSYV